MLCTNRCHVHMCIKHTHTHVGGKQMQHTNTGPNSRLKA